MRLAQDAFDAGIGPELVLYDPEALSGSAAGRRLLARAEGLDIAYPALPAVVAAASDTRNPQGIIMVAREPRDATLKEMATVPFLLILDGIADPGNAGAALRSAAAAGLTHVVFAENTVDPYAGKVVRAGMGAHFRLGLIRSSWEELSPHLRRFQVVAAQSEADKTIYEIDWSGPTALIIGSEAHGLGEDARQVVDVSARIPMSQAVESLNVVAVASVILFYVRQDGLVK